MTDALIEAGVDDELSAALITALLRKVQPAPNAGPDEALAAGVREILSRLRRGGIGEATLRNTLLADACGVCDRIGHHAPWCTARRAKPEPTSIVVK
jgi:hypothetical protein